MPPDTILPFSPTDAGTSADLKSGPEAAAAPTELLASLPQEHIETACRLGLALKPGLSLENWSRLVANVVQMAGHASRRRDTLTAWLGDLLAFGGGKYRGQITEYATAAGFDPGTLRSAYVACSRGRVSCAVHTPDKAALLARLPDGNREAALDLLGADHSLARKALDRTLGWAQSATARAGILPKLMRKIASRILGVKRSPQPCPLQTVDQLRQHLAYYNSPAMDTRHDIGPSQGL